MLPDAVMTTETSWSPRKRSSAPSERSCFRRVFAQPLADRVPADAALYIGWQGSQTMPPAYANSHLKAVVDASNFGALITDFAPRLIQRFGQGNPNIASAMKAITTFGTPLWQHPSALYVASVDFTAPDAPRPRLAILCQAGPDADALLAQLKPIVDAATNSPAPIKAFKAGDVLVLSIGYDNQSDILATAGKGLATNTRFKEALSQVQKDPVAILYVDAEAILAQVNQGMTAGKPDDADRWTKMRDALGLAGLRRIVATGGFDGQNWSTQAFIAAAAPRQGLLTLLDSKPTSDAALRLIPQTAQAAGVEHLDPAGILDLVRAIATQADPKSAAGFDAGLAKANKELGCDLRKDLLETFDREWSYYYQPRDSDPSGLVLINRLAKPVEAESSLNLLEQRAKAELSKLPQGPPLTLSQTKVGPLTVHAFSLPQWTISWTISGGRFYLASSIEGLTDAIENGGKGKSILDNAEFIAMRKQLGGDQAISISYANLPQTATTLYPALMLVANLGFGYARQAGVQPPGNVFPSMEQLTRHLNTAASLTRVDDAGWHYRGQSSFPGSTVLSPNGMATTVVGASAVGTAILLPSLYRAREVANRIACANNLRQISKACLIHAADHGAYPANLSLLMKDATLPAKAFICPAGDNEIPDDLANRTDDAQAQWVVQHSDYVYLGANIKPAGDPNAILAYEKLENHRGEGTNILFEDGHVQWCPLAQAKEMIARQQANPPAAK